MNYKRLIKMKFNPDTYSYGEIRKVGKTGNKIKIGKFCSIGDNVIGFMSGHNIKSISTYPLALVLAIPEATVNPTVHYGNIIVENDVWIGSNVIILGGTTIGNGAVIGAGSIIRKDVEPYSIYTGNPAEFKGYRFGTREIELLQQSKWWNWSIEKIKKNSDILNGRDFNKFRDVMHVEV